MKTWHWAALGLVVVAVGVYVYRRMRRGAPVATGSGI